MEVLRLVLSLFIALALIAALVSEVEAENEITPPRLAGGSELFAALRYYFSEELDRARCITWQESKWLVDAVGLKGERSLWQIHPIHIEDLWKIDADWDDLFDMWENTRVARWLYDLWGWQPWVSQNHACNLGL